MIRTSLLCLLLIAGLAHSSFSQTNGLPPIPEDAFFVTRISGESLTKKMSIADMDALPVFGELFREAARDGSIDSFNDFGIDYDKDAYIFAEQSDSATYVFFSIPLLDLSKFQNSIMAEMRIPEGTASPYAKGEVGVLWNERAVVFSTCILNDGFLTSNKDRLRETYGLVGTDGGNGYNSGNSYYEDAIEELEVVEDARSYEETVDAAESVREYEVEQIEEGVEVPDHEVEESVVESTEPTDETYTYEQDSWEEGEIVTDDYAYGGYSGYDDYYMDYSEKRALQTRWETMRLESMTKTIGSRPIISSPLHATIRTSKADASAYFDYGQYMEVMMNQEMAMMGSRGMMGMYSGLMQDLMNDVAGTTMTMDLDFGKDEITLDAKYTAKGRLGELQSDMLDSKLNKDFLKYMNSDELIGFYTVSFNTESLLEYYTELSSTYIGMMSGDPDAGRLSAELLSLAIDEESLSELLPGNMAVTFSDIGVQTVEYTSYEYDDDFNFSEVTKTKEEMMPTFLMMVETKRPDMAKRMLEVAGRQNEITVTPYGFKLTKSPIPLCIQLKGDMLFIGNDELIATAIQKGDFKGGLSSAHKKMLKKTNSALYFDAERLMSELKMPQGEMMEMLEFAQGKAKSVSMVAGQEGKNTTYATVTMEIPDGEVNGWSYIMNVLNSFYEYETGR